LLANNMSVGNNLATLKKKIRELEERYDRPKHSVTLLAASKQQSIEKILEAYESGQLIFGENYLQEALFKMQALKDQKIEWHFIGALQTNKAKKIAEHFSWVHSVHTIKIASHLNKHRPSHLPRLNICIEVNVSDEESKTGVSIEAVPNLLAACLELPNIKIRGLMTIPAPQSSFAKQRLAFHKLNTLMENLKQIYPLDTLSMGMSNDFAAAIAEGSTLIRIGTAIFGQRSPWQGS
jgi:pyridoxal phosphate enzyme (YggS family)